MTKDLFEIEYLKKLSIEEIHQIINSLKTGSEDVVRKYNELLDHYKALQKEFKERHKKVDYTLLYKSAIQTFGAGNQQIVAIEELSELQKEITKLLRGQGGLINLAEEIADVEIVIEQLKIIYGIKSDVSQYKILKNQRLLELIKEKNKGK